MKPKVRAIYDEFFEGDDELFVLGVFDGVLSRCYNLYEDVIEAQGEEYALGFYYGRLKLPFENADLWLKISKCEGEVSVPETFGDEDTMRYFHEDDDDEFGRQEVTSEFIVQDKHENFLRDQLRGD